MSENHSLEPLLTPDEAGALLGVGRMTVYRLTYAGELPSVKFGGAKRIRQSDLRAFIAAHASAPEAES